jgi:endonuclease/exonuclease/phosphatase family metal-dependent hydrolase
MMKLNVVTWNLGGAPPTFPIELKDNMRAAAATILAMDPLPDIVAFQEVFFPANLRHLSNALEGEYEPVVPAAARTKSGVPWPLLIAPPLTLLAPLAFLWRLRQSGLVSFARRGGSWKPVSTCFEQYEHEASPARLLEGDGYADKGVQETVLLHEPSGREIAVLNTHLQAQYVSRGRPYRELRIQQLRQLRRIANAQAEQGRPVVALGDLNTRPEAADGYGEIVEFWSDLTLTEGRRPAPATTRGQNRWVDYVLGRGTADAAFSSRAVGILPEQWSRSISDHLGLYAHLELGPREVSDRLSLAPLALAALTGPSTRRAWLAGAVALAVEGIVRLQNPFHSST